MPTFSCDFTFTVDDKPDATRSEGVENGVEIATAARFPAILPDAEFCHLTS